MAALGLAVAGNALAPGAGGFVGAIIGGIIDQYITFPLLFGTPKITGPRLDDIQIQTGSEGSPIKLVLGPDNRVAGTLIWAPLDANGKLVVKTVEHSHTQGGKGGGATTKTFTNYVDIAIGLADALLRPIIGIEKVWANALLILDATTTPPSAESIDSLEWTGNANFSSLTIYKGTTTQPIDPVQVAFQGAGNVPRYKRLAYAQFQSLDITNTAGIPSLTFLVRADVEKSVASAISDIMIRANYTSDEFDVTRVKGCLRGYVVAGPQITADVLAVLLQAFSVSVQEVGGKLVFISRGTEIIVPIAEGDLAARESSSGGDVPSATPSKMQLSDCDPLSFPKEVDVTYSDPAIDLQQGTQREQRININADVVTTLSWPITLKDVEARNIARRIIWSAEAECQTQQISIPPSYLTILEGDAISTTVDGETYIARIETLDLGANFLIKVNARLFQKQIYDAQAYVLDSGRGSQSTTPIPSLLSYLMDIPALREEDLLAPAFYYSACLNNPEKHWYGALLYSSSDGAVYTEIAPIPAQGYLGVTKSSLLAPASSTVFDLGSVLRVEINGTLSSTTEEGCIEGDNRLLVGKEILGFVYATLISTSANGLHTYDLTTLARGLRCTEAYMDHSLEGIDEPVALLQAGLVNKQSIGTSGVGVTKYYKTPSVGDLLDNVDAQLFTPTGANIKPFSPVNITLTREDDGSIRVEWTRRSRAFADAFSTAPGPFQTDELPEQYTIEFVRGTSLGSIRRTVLLPGTGLPDITYQASTLSSSASDNSINDSAGLFLLQGLAVGQYLTIEGFTGGGPASPTTGLITSVTATKVLLSGPSLADNSEGDLVTLKQGHRYIYSTTSQTADGFVVGTSTVRARIFQMSTAIGRGFPAEATT